MYNACMQLHSQMDIEVMCAAVADYKPATIAEEKIKKKEENLMLHLTKTKDILKALGEQKTQPIISRLCPGNK